MGRPCPGMYLPIPGFSPLTSALLGFTISPGWVQESWCVSQHPGSSPEGPPPCPSGYDLLLLAKEGRWKPQLASLCAYDVLEFTKCQLSLLLLVATTVSPIHLRLAHSQPPVGLLLTNKWRFAKVRKSDPRFGYWIHRWPLSIPPPSPGPTSGLSIP